MIRRLLVVAALLLGVGCTKDIKNDIKNLQKQVRALEEVTASLKQQIENGALISSVTPLPDGSGWRIEFTGGSSRTTLSPIDIRHGDDGNHGVTPMIEVRTNTDGTSSIWHNTTAGYPESGWTDTGVDLTGPAGSASVTPEFRTVENIGNTVTIQYRTTGDWTDLVTVPTAESTFRFISDAGGKITFAVNDGSYTEYEFEKASTAVRFEVMTFSEIGAAEGDVIEVTFRVNPSNAWIPTTADGGLSKWTLDLVGTRANYEPTPATPYFTLTGIAEKTTGKKGEYVAKIKFDSEAAGKTGYLLALVLNVNSTNDPVLVSSPTFTLGKRAAKTLQPATFGGIQGIIDAMGKGDIIDLSGLPEEADTPTVITLSRDITITAQMNPILGQFGTGGPASHFRNVHFVLTDNATVTFDEILLGLSTDKTQPLVSGIGNVVVKNSTLSNAFPIDIDGDVWIYGTSAELVGGNINHTTEIIADQTLEAGVAPNPAIRARNVTMYGGAVQGGYTWGAGTNASAGIVASGNVTITGEWLPFPANADTPYDYYLESAVVYGGGGMNDGNNGGDAIVTAGKVTITGGVFVCGGDGAVIKDYTLNGGYANVTVGGTGGSGIVAGGDVTLTGTRQEINGSQWFSCGVRPGVGDYAVGVPFKFSGDASSPKRTLTANTAAITGKSRNVAVGGRAALHTIELQDNDHAYFDDCRLGWYADLEVFSGGWYKITNEFVTWGLFNNGTEIPDLP